MRREDLGHTARFKFAKNNSRDLGLCVRAVVRGQSIGMTITFAMPTPRAKSRNEWSVTAVTPAG